jgi:hypothetical protein
VWDTSSRRSSIALLVACAAIALTSGEVWAKVFFSQKEALAQAFPEADRIETKTHILSDEQVSSIEGMARAKIETRLVAIHTAWRGEERLGYAHIDVHTVRTKPEGFMVVLGPDGAVRYVQILAFYEPLDYLPTNRWYQLFAGKSRSDGLRLGRDIDAISGATLSARAATEGVRRALAYYEVLLRI